jgi:hypothetical protein
MNPDAALLLLHNQIRLHGLHFQEYALYLRSEMFAVIVVAAELLREQLPPEELPLLCRASSSMPGIEPSTFGEARFGQARVAQLPQRMTHHRGRIGYPNIQTCKRPNVCEYTIEIGGASGSMTTRPCAVEFFGHDPKTLHDRLKRSFERAGQGLSRNHPRAEPPEYPHRAEQSVVSRHC